MESPKIYVVPVHLIQRVRGYKSLRTYSCAGATAIVAVKDPAKTETHRVRIQRSGSPDKVKFFRGKFSLQRAMTHAYWSVVPVLTREEVDALL